MVGDRESDRLSPNVNFFPDYNCFVCELFWYKLLLASYDTPMLQYSELGCISIFPACLQDHAVGPTQCLYASTALKYTKFLMFIAPEMPGIWQTQCQFEGGAYPSRSGPGLVVELQYSY